MSKTLLFLPITSSMIMAAFGTTSFLMKAVPTKNNLPGVWQRGMGQLFENDVLPQSLGGKPENKHLAWYGDKILGLAAATSLVGIFGESLDRGVATQIHSKAVSNSFMREKFDVLVPVLANAQDIQPKITDNIAGTIIETGVARFYIQKKRAEINNLVDWLLKQAIIDSIRSCKK